MPLLKELTKTIAPLENQLTTLSDQAPVPALKAVVGLKRLTADVGQEPPHGPEVDEPRRELLRNI